MIKKALVLALAAVACAAWFASSELPELGEGDTYAATVGVAGFPSGRAGISAARARTFATLPDRGNLVSYPTASPARVDGAYTWHRADLSEEHAFRSLQTGTLRITSPSGKPLEFEYSRHVEHPSGDWTWIGRLKGGQDADEALITFGERAAFGSISEPGRLPLRLTTQAGVAWLVETDSRKIASIRNEVTHPTGPDYLLPPDRTAALASLSAGPSASASVPSPSAALSAAATTTVDVVIGYTSGFAAAQGGQSQAVTRLNNMVEIANQAYANSQLDAAIRMVHALQVNYPDSTANQVALENLTGYRSGAGQIPVDPAFAALRAARDQYGGDLVTLVRKFETPENDGCGIAWLIGGGQSGIDSGDAPFGYSVVSDGTDVGTDGKSYFCRQETLAHELGHNMGSQHDRVTATENGQLKYGVFTYSFGHKTDAPAGNFYTVMAYGDAGQVTYRVFSNPRSTFCGGLPCGVADQADNARSLAQTMPVVSSFRASTVGEPTPQPSLEPDLVDANPFDANGDGYGDLLWRYTGGPQIAYWTMLGGARTGGVGYSVAGPWRVVATGDFNADGLSDLIWSDGAVMQLWQNSGGGFLGLAMRSYPSGYRVVAAGDLDGDRRTDLVWRDDASNVGIWRMSGPTIVGSSSFLVPVQWRVAASGDLSGDGRADVVWTNESVMQLWVSNGSLGFTGAAMPNYPQGWSLVGVGDVGGDSYDDLLWRHADTGQLAYWQMQGAVRVQGIGYAPGSSWRLIQVADMTADGRADIVWTNGAAMQLWRSQGNGSFAGEAMPGFPSGWTLLRR